MLPGLSPDLVLWALVFLRIGALVVAAPLLSSPLVPIPVRAGTALALTLVTGSLVTATPAAIASLPALATAAAANVAVGLLLGFGASLFLATLEVAGSVLDAATGLSLMQILDPARGTSTSLLSSFFLLLGALLFLLLGGLRFLTLLVLASFHQVPLSGMALRGPAVAMLVSMTGETLLDGMLLALPFLAALFLANLALGLLARVMPQFNLLSVGFSLETPLALLLLALFLPALVVVSQEILSQIEVQLVQLTWGLGP